ncbi:amidohydrolase family protein [Hyphobacterium sp.]|jgi:imidazolonepropionase-like amidohydrolase|uniref:amidohydrolase family protein n=1 Tax=Hyphobacterium sp. TaxID=2004662 RepID=UPI003BAC2422
MRHLVVLAAASLALSGTALAQDLAVINGRVITNTAQGQIESGGVLIRDGLIVEVGADIAIPDGVTTIDADSGWITPGLFAAYSQLGLIEVALEDASNDAAAAESAFSAALDVADSYNPNGSYLATHRMEGITRFAVFPSTGQNIFAGQGALGHTGGGMDSLFATRSFVFADLSQSGAATAGGSRSAAWAYLEAAFGDARAYPGRYASGNGDALNRYDAAAMVDVVRGRIPLVMEVDRATDIRRAIRFAAENAPVQIVIYGGAEAWMVAEELAAARIPVLMDPIGNLPVSFDALGHTLEAAGRLNEAGVTVAYTTQTADGYFNARLLAQHAGNAVTNGVPWADAFRAITLTPAEIYGAGDQFGALAAGYVADVVVWDGDPLEVMSAPTHVIIEGEQTDLTSRQTRLRDRYADMEDTTPFGYRH